MYVNYSKKTDILEIGLKPAKGFIREKLNSHVTLLKDVKTHEIIGMIVAKASKHVDLDYLYIRTNEIITIHTIKKTNGRKANK